MSSDTVQAMIRGTPERFTDRWKQCLVDLFNFQIKNCDICRSTRNPKDIKILLHGKICYNHENLRKIFLGVVKLTEAYLNEIAHFGPFVPFYGE